MTTATTATAAVRAFQRFPIENLHVRNLVVNDIEDQHPCPWCVEYHIAMPRPVGTFEPGFGVEALTEVVSAIARSNNDQRVYLSREGNLVLGQQGIAKLTREDWPSVYD